MPPILYINKISNEEKIFIDILIYSFWLFYFYEFGSFMKEIIKKNR